MERSYEITCERTYDMMWSAIVERLSGVELHSGAAR